VHEIDFSSSNEIVAGVASKLSYTENEKLELS